MAVAIDRAGRGRDPAPSALLDRPRKHLKRVEDAERQRGHGLVDLLGGRRASVDGVAHHVDELPDFTHDSILLSQGTTVAGTPAPLLARSAIAASARLDAAPSCGSAGSPSIVVT